MTEIDSTTVAIAAADRLFDEYGEEAGLAVPEPADRAAARAAVTRLGERFAALRGAVRHVLARSSDQAAHLSDDDLQGLSEVVQNAEDLGASEVRILLQQGELLLAHNGAPVRLPDVLALAMPWLTTKEEDAESTGRFGIGLMTLRAISPLLEIHSGHYDVRFGNSTVTAVAGLRTPSGFVGPEWTVLRVPFEDGSLTVGDISRWLSGWTDSALLFLRHVTRIVLLGGDLRPLRELRLERGREKAEHLLLGGAMRQVRLREVESADGTRWLHCTAVVSAPEGVRRAGKATADTVAVSLAIPRGGPAPGQVHVRLPVTATALPFRIGACVTDLLWAQAGSH
ncbi:sacsin N-terminal ATP-binding-like domain-containing protein [Kitasatospora kazusensis]|uniref:sacsin N-terminal ATP-binding-like domain-containing protein n=1 Tax=Kitasatospora kazusensis TaxID=407974 RepID=UPI0031CF7D86